MAGVLLAQSEPSLKEEARCETSVYQSSFRLELTNNQGNDEWVQNSNARRKTQEVLMSLPLTGSED